MSERDPHQEPDNSTVDDWHGQWVNRMMVDADAAVANADGDLVEAEKRFDAQRGRRDSRGPGRATAMTTKKQQVVVEPRPDGRWARQKNGTQRAASLHGTQAD